jgi:mono/diheme cytochrome c family protein
MVVRKTPMMRAWLGVGFCLSLLLVVAILAACDNGPGMDTPGLTGAVAGERVYMQYCNSCHPGGNQGAGPALKPLLPNRSDEQIRTVVRQGKRPMPGYNENNISDDQLTNLILYMRTLK